jgi:hypothetical protein
MKRTAASVSLATIALALFLAPAQFASGATGTWLPGVPAWSDHLHGWHWVAHYGTGGRDYPVIESSENGGRSWHAIYRSTRPGTIGAVLPTSESVGLAALSSIVGSHTVNRMVVTFNNGKSWHRLPAGDFWDYLIGSGPDL